MAKKEVKVVETKQAKVDMKTLAESIETAFKKNVAVDVIADTHLENPTALSYDDFHFIHFYRKGTMKDMFQLYITGKSGKFIIRKQVAELLGKDVNQKSITKKNKQTNTERVIHVEVSAPIDTVPEVAEKIITACAENDKLVAEARATKKAEKKSAKKVSEAKTEKKATEKKADKKVQAVEKKTKKVSNK